MERGVQYQVLLAILVVCGGHLMSLSVLAVSPGRYNELEREQFLQLDRESAGVYETSLEQLDQSLNVTYDDELFKLLRAYRNSIIFQFFDYTYSNQEVMQQSRGPKVNEKLCQQQLETLVSLSRAIYQQEPQNYTLAKNGSIPFSAINFLDTYGRAESGILDGNSVWLGSYSGCMKAKIPARSAQVFRPGKTEGSDIIGRYCVAHLKAKSWPKWDIYFENRISIKVGLCLPESCHSLDYAQNETIRANVDYLARSNLLQPFNSNRYYTDHLYCLPDEDSPFRQLDLGAQLFLAFCLGWAMVLIYANIAYGMRMRKLQEKPEVVNGCANLQAIATGAAESSSKDHNSTGFDFVKAFSFVSNLETLCETNLSFTEKPMPPKMVELHDLSNGFQHGKKSISLGILSSSAADESKHGFLTEVANQVKEPPKSKKRVHMDILHGIRVGACCYIVMGHTFMSSFTFSKDLKDLNLKVLDITFIAFMNAVQVVQLFYLISSFRLTYASFKSRDQLMQPTYWLRVLIRRYLRLIPVYFLVFWFAKHVATHTGSGPLWVDYRMDIEHPRSYCSEESWLSMLTLSATDYRFPDGCVPQAWYLSCDFRCTLIVPFYIVLLAWNTSYGYVAIFLTCLMSFWRQVHLLLIANIDWQHTGNHFRAHSPAIMVDRTHDFYMDLLARLKTCLLGVICGHSLYLYESRQIKEWPWWLRSYGLKVASTLAAIISVVPQILSQMSFLAAPLSTLIAVIDLNLFLVILFGFETLMEVSFGIILILLLTGGGLKTMNKLLSSKLAKIFSALSFVVFLVAVEFMFKFPATKTENYYWFLFTSGIFFYFVSNVIAFFIHLLYEIPISNITRHIL